MSWPACDGGVRSRWLERVRPDASQWCLLRSTDSPGAALPDLIAPGMVAVARDDLERQLADALARSKCAGVVVDLSDHGLRSAPEGAWLTALLRAASDTSLEVVVLDRPNPMNGLDVEGPVAHPGFESVWAPPGLPLRHGLTPAERAQWTVREERLSVRLTVERCADWTRDYDTYDGPALEGRPPVVEAACLLLSHTLWTVRTLHHTITFGHPEVSAPRLVELFEKGAADAELQGVQVSPAATGLEVELVSPRAAQPVLVGLVMMEAALRAYALQGLGPFPWRRSENNVRQFTADRWMGSPETRLGLESRVRPTELFEAWRPGLENYEELRSSALLYR
jgi:hypothetical protein